MDTLGWSKDHNWAYMPKLVLVKIFAYLPWRDRAHAALVCKRWLNAFCSPEVWRAFTYHPPAQGLPRLQYDLKTYYLSKGIRNIGWHIQYLRFPETGDYFMLNRVLSLIAEFFEAHPSPHKFSANSVVSTEILFPALAALEAALSPSSSSSSLSPPEHRKSSLASPAAAIDHSNEETEKSAQQEVTEKIPLSMLAEAVFGDPDLENSIKLAMKLQQREYERDSSSSDSSSSLESGIGISSHSRTDASLQLSSSVPIRFQFRSVSTTTPPSTSAMTGAGQAGTRGRRYQRSVSCKFPCTYKRLPYPPDTSNLPPPCVRAFSLDFHAEFDEASGVVYGSGGALFATIVRVLSQLKCLRALYLRNLFLSQSDARQLLIEVSTVAGPTLERASLLHVCKITHERPAQETTSQSEVPIQGRFDLASTTAADTSHDDDRYWYLRDPRWLGARPRLLGWNPLADLFALFPNLSRLEIALTQLTGPMLLRLIYQTQLSVLILTQTDLSPRWMEYIHGEGLVTLQSVEGSHSGMEVRTKHTTDEYYVDWGADVPIARHGAPPEHRSATLGGTADFWRPVASEFWHQAVCMRPTLRVHVRLRFLYSRASSDLCVLALPALPAPLVSIVCVFGSGDQTATYRLFERSIPSITQYASTLTDIVLLTELDLGAVETEEREKEQMARLSGRRLCFSYQSRQKGPQITSTQDILPQPLDDQLLRLLSACPNVSSLSIGGRLLNIHLTTASQICRLLVKAARARPRSGGHAQKPPPPVLHFDVGSIRLSGPIPQSATERDSSVFLELMRDCRGKEVELLVAKERAAECLIAAALGSPRWHFMQTDEFRRHVLNYAAV
ncbi:F-box/LRR-repeat protein [Echinococcus granulosus]|uniref:F-box/LRR-repeat protein n=2 Tax=Echinococcus granulosus TaxID=6210 RepID=W6UNR6_ECHGR|nr:F-box/LRR-repeat protein [Echinococcus granulosus]EUB62893.1 F-box/LRR-repeat protein [Echinococcus granulosus]